MTGAPVDDDGVCTEHGETACVIGLVRAPADVPRVQPAGGVASPA